MRSLENRQHLFHVLFGKHTAKILILLSDVGPARFGEMKNAMNCSSKVLNDQLKHLVYHQLVVREYQGHQPTHVVEYYLSEFGKEIVPVLNQLSDIDQRIRKTGT